MFKYRLPNAEVGGQWRGEIGRYHYQVLCSRRYYGLSVFTQFVFSDWLNKVNLVCGGIISSHEPHD
jgi:hypothetical protein